MFPEHLNYLGKHQVFQLLSFSWNAVQFLWTRGTTPNVVKKHAPRINTFYQISRLLVHILKSGFKFLTHQSQLGIFEQVSLAGFMKKTSVYHPSTSERTTTKRSMNVLDPLYLRREQSRGRNSNAGKMDQTWSRSIPPFYKNAQDSTGLCLVVNYDTAAYLVLHVIVTIIRLIFCYF